MFATIRTTAPALLILLLASTRLTAAPALLVLSKAENTLAVVDPGSLQVLRKVPVGEGPHEVVVSADGKTAFVANYGNQKPGNTMSIIEIRMSVGALDVHLRDMEE